MVAPEDPDGVELVLEPDEHPAAKPFKQALVVRFTQPPVDMGPVKTAVLDDTCGNLIQIATQTAL